MPYRYRCGVCRTTSRPLLTRVAAESHALFHRRLMHGGDIPDGEQLLTVPWLSQWFGPRLEQQPADVVVVGAVLAVLVLAALLARIL